MLVNDMCVFDFEKNMPLPVLLLLLILKGRNRNLQKLLFNQLAKIWFLCGTKNMYGLIHKNNL